MNHSVNDTVIDLFLDWLRQDKGGTGHATYQQYRRSLECFDDWLSIDALDAEALDIREYLLSLRNDGYSGSTIDAHFTALRKLYTISIEQFDFIEENPCDGITFSDLDVYDNRNNDDTLHYITHEEKDTMIEAARENGMYIRDRLIIELFWQTGLRKGELRQIELSNVDQDSNTIRVFGEKTGKWRDVTYQPSLNMLLSVWIEQERPLRRDSKYLFPTKRSDAISRGTIRRVIRECASEFNEVVGETQNGKPKWRVTPHTLRHSHAVAALKAGVPERFIQQQLGHENISTTEKYLRIVTDDVAEAYQAFEA